MRRRAQALAQLDAVRARFRDCPCAAPQDLEAASGSISRAARAGLLGGEYDDVAGRAGSPASSPGASSPAVSPVNSPLADLPPLPRVLEKGSLRDEARWSFAGDPFGAPPASAKSVREVSLSLGLKTTPKVGLNSLRRWTMRASPSS